MHVATDRLGSRGNTSSREAPRSSSRMGVHMSRVSRPGDDPCIAPWMIVRCWRSWPYSSTAPFAQTYAFGLSLSSVNDGRGAPSDPSAGGATSNPCFHSGSGGGAAPSPSAGAGSGARVSVDHQPPASIVRIIEIGGSGL